MSVASIIKTRRFFGPGGSGTQETMVTLYELTSFLPLFNSLRHVLLSVMMALRCSFSVTPEEQHHVVFIHWLVICPVSRLAITSPPEGHALVGGTTAVMRHQI